MKHKPNTETNRRYPNSTTTPNKNNNTMPLWPDKATPVRFGGYGKSNKIVWKSPEKKKNK